MKRIQLKPLKFSTNLRLLLAFFASFYLLGMLAPDYFWASHQLAFLPPALQVFFFIAGLIFLLRPFYKQEALVLGEKSLRNILPNKLSAPLLASLLFAVIFYAFPIHTDYYGDAISLVGKLDKKVSILPEGANDAFFTFGLSPYDGHKSILAVVTFIAYYLGISYGEAFRLLDALAGFCFLFIWLNFINLYFSQLSSKLVGALLAISAPFLLIFYGHAESYAPVFAAFSLFLWVQIRHTKNKSRNSLWIQLAVLLLCMKLHPIALLFIPSTALLLIDYYYDNHALFSLLKSWKGIANWILIPIFALGALLYFFIFEDHVDSRDLNQDVSAFDHLFLPLFSPDPPLDTYNLLSFNHLFDYLCEIFIWSPIALLIILLVLLAHGKAVNWEKRSLQLTGLNLILFASFFFMVNPLLSMQIDWDLMAIPAPIFIMFSLLLLKELEDKNLSKQILSPAIGLAIFAIPLLLIHTDKEALSQRYESLGIRVYHSYYQRAKKIIHYGLDMGHYDSRAAYEERKQAVLSKLEPYARKGLDFEYARLWAEEGRYWLRVGKDYDQALNCLKKAEEYFAQEKNVVLYLMEAHYVREEYQKAFNYSKELMRQQYPSERKSLTIGLQCSLEAEVYQEAKNIAEFYLERWQDNQTVEKVYTGLTSGNNPDSLKYLFRRN